MNTLIAEQPLMVSLMLGAVAAGLIYAWLQTGKKAAAIGGLVAALLIPVAWVIADRWVTDREQIRELIHDTAEAVQNNEFELVYNVIGDAKTKAQARSELPNYTFKIAKVGSIQNISMVDGTYPPEAVVELTASVTLSDRRGRFQELRVPRRLVLKLHKIDDDWLVIAYRHMPIMGNPDRFSDPNRFTGPESNTTTPNTTTSDP